MTLSGVSGISGISAEEQVKKLARLFYLVPQQAHPAVPNPYQVVILMRHGAEVALVPATDLLSSYKDDVEDFIEDALEVHGSAFDNRVLRQIINLCPEPYGNRGHFIYGLYLYLASEVSRLPNYLWSPNENKSFLFIGREQLEKYAAAGKTDNDGNIISPADRKQWLIDVLTVAGLYQHQHFQQFVEDWCNKGCFYVWNGTENELHYYNSNKGNGIWVELARLVCDPLERLSQNEECVELALAERNTYAGMTQEQAYAYTKGLVDQANELVKTGVKRYTAANSGNELVSKIKQGRKTRRQDLQKEKQILAQKWQQNLASNRDEAEGLAHQILPLLSQEARDTLEATGTRLIFVEGPNIRSGYPADNSMGISHKQSEETRGALGVWEEYHNMIYVCSAGRSMEVIAQSLEHEITHRSLNDVRIVVSSLYGKRNTNGVVIQAGEVDEFYTACEKLYPKLCAEAVIELAENMQQGSREALKSLHHSSESMVEMFSGMSLAAQLKVYERCANAGGQDIRTSFFLALPTVLKANIFIALPDDKAQIMLMDALQPEHKYDLYRSLRPDDREKLYGKLLNFNKQVIDEFNVKYNFNPQHPDCNLPYTHFPAVPLNQHELFCANQGVLPKTVCLQDMYETISSGTVIDIYFKLRASVVNQLVFSPEARTELNKKLDDYNGSRPYALAADPAVEKELVTTLSAALIRRFTLHMPPEVAADIESNHTKPALMQLRDKPFEAMEHTNYANVLNAQGMLYANYPSYHKKKEVAANLPNSNHINSFLSNIPQTKSMQPVRDVIAMKKPAMEKANRKIADKNAEKAKERQILRE